MFSQPDRSAGGLFFSGGLADSCHWVLLERRTKCEQPKVFYFFFLLLQTYVLSLPMEMFI